MYPHTRKWGIHRLVGLVLVILTRPCRTAVAAQIRRRNPIQGRARFKFFTGIAPIASSRGNSRSFEPWRRLRGGSKRDRVGNYDVVIVNETSSELNGKQGIIVETRRSRQDQEEGIEGARHLNKSFFVRFEGLSHPLAFPSSSLNVVAPDLARGCPVEISPKLHTDQNPSRITDGKTKTLFPYESKGAFHTSVDLGRPYWIQMAKIRWGENQYPKHYVIQMSNTTSGPWRNVSDILEGASGWIDHVLVDADHPGKTTGQYVALLSWGESPSAAFSAGIHSMAIYGTHRGWGRDGGEEEGWEMGTFRTGDTVVAEGLVKNRELNGKQGTIIKPSRAGSRFTVDFPNLGTYSILPWNLQRVSGVKSQDSMALATGVGIGDVVEIHGLKRNVDLNGVIGVVTRPSSNLGRFTVEYGPKDDVIAIFPENLRRLVIFSADEPPADRINLAANMSVNASSYPNPERVPEAVIDGQNTTYWCPNTSTAREDEWLVVNHTEAIEIQGVTLRWLGTPPEKYNIEVIPEIPGDYEEWKEVSRGSRALGDTWHSHKIVGGTRVRAVRIRFKSVKKKSPCLGDLALFGLRNPETTPNPEKTPSLPPTPPSSPANLSHGGYVRVWGLSAFEGVTGRVVEFLSHIGRYVVDLGEGIGKLSFLPENLRTLATGSPNSSREVSPAPEVSPDQLDKGPLAAANTSSEPIPRKILEDISDFPPDARDGISTEDEEEGVWVTGERVEALGLRSNVELNGRTGFVDRYNVTTGRYTVVFGEIGKPPIRAALRPENLRRAPRDLGKDKDLTPKKEEALETINLDEMMHELHNKSLTDLVKDASDEEDIRPIREALRDAIPPPPPGTPGLVNASGFAQRILRVSRESLKSFHNPKNLPDDFPPVGDAGNSLEILRGKEYSPEAPSGIRDSNETLHAGDWVKIFGYPEGDPLNGQPGEVLETPRSQESRVLVRVPGHPQLNVRRERLQRISEPFEGEGEKAEGGAKWEVGDTVEAFGLKERDEINGEWGEVLNFDSKVDRYTVDFGAFGKLAVRDENLRGPSEPLPPAEFSRPGYPTGCVDLARGRPVQASSFENKNSGLTAERITDGNPQTRWSSTFADNQWISVDLGRISDISSVRIHWESAFADEYAIDVKLNEEDEWFEIARMSEGAPGWVEHPSPAGTLARHVRVRCLKRATPFGFSIHALEVVGRRLGKENDGWREEGDGDYWVGDRVEIWGLETDADLNGRYGRVVGFDKALGRHIVHVACDMGSELDSGKGSEEVGSRLIAVSPDNLKTVEIEKDFTTHKRDADTETHGEGDGSGVEAGSDPRIPIGSVCIAFGLRKDQNLNGKRCIVRIPPAPEGMPSLTFGGERYIVDFGENGGRRALRSANLRVVEEPQNEDEKRKEEQDRMVRDISSESRPVRMGDYVRVKGLKNNTHFNDRTGRVGYFHTEEARYIVSLDGRKKEKIFVSPNNLERVPEVPRESPVMLHAPGGLSVPVPAHEYRDSHSQSRLEESPGISERPRIPLSRPYVKEREFKNYARKATVTASSVEGEHSPEFVVDGDGWTRWSSTHEDNQYLTLDLGELRPVSGVALFWETAFAEDFAIEESTDMQEWREVYQESGRTQPGWSDFTLPVGHIHWMRGVRIRCMKRGTPYGFSIHHFAVYGPKLSPDDSDDPEPEPEPSIGDLDTSKTQTSKIFPPPPPRDPYAPGGYLEGLETSGDTKETPRDSEEEWGRWWSYMRFWQHIPRAIPQGIPIAFPRFKSKVVDSLRGWMRSSFACVRPSRKQGMGALGIDELEDLCNDNFQEMPEDLYPGIPIEAESQSLEEASGAGEEPRTPRGDPEEFEKDLEVGEEDLAVGAEVVLRSPGLWDGRRGRLLAIEEGLGLVDIYGRVLKLPMTFLEPLPLHTLEDRLKEIQARQMPNGTAVSFHGLKNAPELNGKEGVIIGVDYQIGRIRVLNPTTQDIHLVKVENIRRSTRLRSPKEAQKKVYERRSSRKRKAKGEGGENSVEQNSKGWIGVWRGNLGNEDGEIQL